MQYLASKKVPIRRAERKYMTNGNSKIKTLNEYEFRKLVSCVPDTSALDAARLMEDRNVGCVIVTEREKLVGIATRYDFIHSLIVNPKAKSASDTKIREIMHSSPVTIDPSLTMADALKLMIEKKVERLVVSDARKNANAVLGVISLEDVVASLGNESFRSEKEYRIVLDMVKHLRPMLLARYDGEEREELSRDMNNELKALRRLLEEAEVALRS